MTFPPPSSPSSSSSDAMPPVLGAFEEALCVQGETRPWGRYWVLQDEPHFKLKKLEVFPAQRLSLQLHHHREEHWLVVKGQPTITVGERTWQASVGEQVFIPCETKHRLANTTDASVELIEVQLGQSFDETDIVRFQDDYQRS